MEFPFTSRALTIDGHLIHYVDEGDQRGGRARPHRQVVRPLGKGAGVLVVADGDRLRVASLGT